MKKWSVLIIAAMMIKFTADVSCLTAVAQTYQVESEHGNQGTCVCIGCMKNDTGNSFWIFVTNNHVVEDWYSDQDGQRVVTGVSGHVKVSHPNKKVSGGYIKRSSKYDIASFAVPKIDHLKFKTTSFVYGVPKGETVQVNGRYPATTSTKGLISSGGNQVVSGESGGAIQIRNCESDNEYYTAGILWGWQKFYPDGRKYTQYVTAEQCREFLQDTYNSSPPGIEWTTRKCINGNCRIHYPNGYRYKQGYEYYQDVEDISKSSPDIKFNPRTIKGDVGPMGPVGPKGDKGDKGSPGSVSSTSTVIVNLKNQIANLEARITSLENVEAGQRGPTGKVNVRVVDERSGKVKNHTNLEDGSTVLVEVRNRGDLNSN